MLARILGHLRAQWMGALALFLVLTGGIAYAANAIASSDIINGEVKTADIGNDQVRSVDVRDDTLANGGLGSADIAPDSLQGADIVEGTLQNVDASTVSGLQIRKIDFTVPYGTGPTTVLDLAGLRITAECQPFGDRLDVKAFSSKDFASAFYFAGHTGDADDTNTSRDIDSAQFDDHSWDTVAPLQIDNATPINGDNSIGTLHYLAPDGSVVVAHLAFDEGRFGCDLTGIAIGG